MLVQKKIKGKKPKKKQQDPSSSKSSSSKVIEDVNPIWKERENIILNYDGLLDPSSELTKHEAEILACHCMCKTTCNVDVELLEGMYSFISNTF